MDKFNLRITGNLGFEFWKDIPGYEGRYQASTYGRVRRKPIYRKTNNWGGVELLKERILTQNKRNDGYLQVHLVDGLKLSHKLVCGTFAPRLSVECKYVNHKDECKTNNRVENLEWCTFEYNINYGTRNARAGKKLKIANSKPVLQFDLNGNFIRRFTSTQEAASQNNLQQSDISRCCNGKRKRVGNYKWRYE